jgi:hypothetical protein
MGGEELVEFSNGTTVGNLRWSKKNRTNFAVSFAIPMGGMSDADKAAKVAEAARHFASGVRFASHR